MAYQRGSSPQPATTGLSVERARRRNAELRRELAALTVENTRLEAQVQAVGEQVRAAAKDLTAARRKLTRQIRDSTASRAQAERIAAEQQAAGPEPVHGGAGGLLEAAGEARAAGIRHGTRRMYDTGCRCTDCQGWRDRKSARELVLQKQRVERLIAARLAA